MTTLEIYEKTVEVPFGAQSGGLRGLDTGLADTGQVRKSVDLGNRTDGDLTVRSFKPHVSALAMDLYTHLDNLSGPLTQMIEAANTLSVVSGPRKMPTMGRREVRLSWVKTLRVKSRRC